MEHWLSSETLSLEQMIVKLSVYKTRRGTGWSPKTFGRRWMWMLRKAHIAAHCLREYRREESCFSKDLNHKMPLPGCTVGLWEIRTGPPGYPPENRARGLAPAVAGSVSRLELDCKLSEAGHCSISLVLTHFKCRASQVQACPMTLKHTVGNRGHWLLTSWKGLDQMHRSIKGVFI